LIRLLKRRRGVQNQTSRPKSQPKKTAPDESDLVKRARDENMSAYDDLVRRYQERIYATIYHMTSNHEDRQ